VTNAIVEQAPRPARTVSLVLGSGGARGLAHIGVIRELEARGYVIKAIAGCSIGALVGGLHGVGKLEEFADWVGQLARGDILSLLDVTSARGGFIAGRKIMERLHDWIGQTTIEDLPIRYTAVAVDIEREKEIWMSEGPLFEAIRASISIPGVFTPHRYRGRLLVDGGVLNPIPVAPTVNFLTDLTVVVDANGPPTDYSPVDDAYVDEGTEAEGEGEPGFIARKLDMLGWADKKKPTAKDELTIVDVLMRSLDTMQAAITRQHLAVFHPDIVIRVPRNACMMQEFHRGLEMIELGSRIASELLDHPDLERKQWL
jgi:NTE family protein